MLPIVFSHANSFPAATYRLLFSLLRKRGCETRAVDSFGHDPRYPVSNNWPHLVQQLADFARAEVERRGEPVFFVGHSLGGFLSVMAAALHPELARGVLLIDSPLISGWRANALGMAKRTQLVGSVSPGKVSQRRRNHWANDDEALAYFRTKKAFAHWHPEVLQDYVTHCLKDQDDKRMLAFEREVETAIYNTLPHNLDALLRRHPLRCPAAFIGGRGSQEMKQVGMDMTLRITQGRSMILDGSHLFPMERPDATAAAIEASLLNLVSLGSA
ncbi:alpha/beta hydrolase [Acidovorax sp. CCYZU-2555]|uniref:alpha/beta fold hydrolase n=1 Tax=Acidovorax sp. CCYZU-2555 TaxID=2835042 RepID=UPI001BCD10D7|nr:alpha/beta hydrolase [Acidovorax sp. CCYZU-2555]MBS7778141.1 alpha/beta hydrolase [Acidovorax sp. CCYZU-2555]